jgi:outer membrane lipoprotein carrier protein
MNSAAALIRNLLLTVAVIASPAQAQDARARLDGFTRGANGLAANFRQQVYTQKGELGEESTGTVKMQVPRQFRWEYVQPFPNLIVADGDHLWIYDPDLEQVTVRQQSLEEQNSPLAALIDPGELDRQFVVKDAGTAEGLQWLELTPRKPDDAPFERARLGLTADGLQRMEMFDNLGQRTLMIFSGWQRNPAFAAGTFTFKPPAGVDVVGEVAPGAEVLPLGD